MEKETGVALKGPQMGYDRTVSGIHPISELDWAIDGDTWAEVEAE